MAGGAVPASTPGDVSRVEAPVTLKAYFLCAFAAFGGIFFGYDSGYISGVMGMSTFYKLIEGDDAEALTASNKSLITSILSVGTFFGAIIAGDIADWIGRRPTIIAGCGIFAVGVAVQIATQNLGMIVAGRLIAGLGVGFVSAVLILYMSEIAPRKVRGAIVSGYQFCVTIGLMLASVVTYATEERTDATSYRIPIALQLVWGGTLALGLFFLPESPRYHVKKGKLDEAAAVLARLRGHPVETAYVQDELSEIIANHEYELALIPSTGYFGSWAACFTGSLWEAKSNLRRTILGTSLQMMQQWTGVNFVFYFGTTFFQDLGTIKDPFLMSMITTIVNVVSTPLSFWIVERFGRRPIMIWGALGMVICQFIVAIIGTITSAAPAVAAMIAFICLYVSFFATTWGPGAWVLVGEIYPLQIRSRGVALSTASNWLWNCIIAIITPYMVDVDQANLGPKVFFIWGSLCTCCFVYAYMLIPETKGLTLEQVDAMMEETTPRTSAKWTPHDTFAAKQGFTEKNNVAHAETASLEKTAAEVV